MKLLLGMCALVMCLLVVARGEELPDAPSSSPSSSPAPSLPAAELPAHARFWDRTETWGTVAHAGARLTDTALSCADYARGHTELSLPFRSCAGLAGYSAAAVSGQIVTDWVLWRTGHQRLRKWSPWVWTAVDAIAIGRTVNNWNHWR